MRAHFLTYIAEPKIAYLLISLGAFGMLMTRYFIDHEGYIQAQGENDESGIRRDDKKRRLGQSKNTYRR